MYNPQVKTTKTYCKKTLFCTQPRLRIKLDISSENSSNPPLKRTLNFYS